MPAERANHLKTRVVLASGLFIGSLLYGAWGQSGASVGQAPEPPNKLGGSQSTISKGSQAQAAVPKDNPSAGLRYGGLKRSAACPMGFEVVGRKTCSHGPDPFPDGVNARTTPAFGVAATREGSPTVAAAAPPVNCYGNGSDGKRVEVLYAVSSSATNRYATVLDTIRQSMSDADVAVNDSGLATGEPRHIRFVTDASCNVVVRNVTISPSSAADFSTMANQLYAMGYNRIDRKYLVMADANVYCGLGELWDDDSKGAGNTHNGFIGMFARVDVPCWQTDSMGASTVMHELGHNMGAVQASAPHDSGGGHCTDEWDVMCYSDEPLYPSMSYVCASTRERLYDCNNDDYFHTNPSTSNYLYGHWNVADSEFLAGSEGTDYVPITPVRVMDTRSGLGWSSALGAGETATVQMAGVTGVPDYADALVVNVTAVNPSANTFLSAFPSGTPRPNASTLNVVAHETRANLATVKVGEALWATHSGWIDVYNYAGTTNVVADVVGYYGHRNGTRFVSVSPTRVLDSRYGTGGYSTPWGPGTTRTVSVASAVPSGATSVVLNVTSARTTATSFLTVFAAGAARPWTSNVNTAGGQTIPNLVVSQINAARAISIYNYQGNVDVIADVAGYFVGGGSGREFVPLAPIRVMDSRSGVGTSAVPFGAGQTRTLQLGGVGSIPVGASAAVINLTGVHSTEGGFVTAWPQGVARPNASSLNLRLNNAVANLATVRLSASGQISLYNWTGSVDLIGDVVGYYK